MTGPVQVVMMPAAELAVLIESAVSSALRKACLPVKPAAAPAVPLFLSEQEVIKAYRIGPTELRRLIVRGKLPSTTRRIRGGRESYFIRTDDADRVLGATASN